MALTIEQLLTQLTTSRQGVPISVLDRRYKSDYDAETLTQIIDLLVLLEAEHDGFATTDEVDTAIENSALSSEDAHVAAGTLSTWTLDTGDIYYADFAHNLGTQDLLITLFNDSTKEVLIPDKVDLIDTNTARVFIEGNETTVRIIVADAIFGSQEYTGINVTNQSLDYTAVNNDVVVMDASSGERNVTITPSANHFVTIKKLDASANKVIITPSSGLVEQESNLELTLQGEVVRLASDGTNFFVV